MPTSRYVAKAGDETGVPVEGRHILRHEDAGKRDDQTGILGRNQPQPISWGGRGLEAGVYNRRPIPSDFQGLGLLRPPPAAAGGGGILNPAAAPFNPHGSAYLNARR